jgi:hypothetical protein
MSGMNHPTRLIPKTRAGSAGLLAATALLMLAGCVESTLTGQVRDIQDEALPGVAVTVAGTPYQDTTDALGGYAVPAPDGPCELVFHKTGYTSGRLAVYEETDRAQPLTPMKLWPLPPAKGVYLFRDFRYAAAKPFEVERFETAEGDLVFGTSTYQPGRGDVVVAESPLPLILCHNMPLQDVMVHRLEREEVAPDDEEEGVVEEVWRPAAVFPASLEAIDPPDVTLQRVRLFSPLEPGLYAVSWGSLEGDLEGERRMFVFTVPGDEPPPGAEAANGQDPPDGT